MRRSLPQKMQEAARSAVPFSGICFRNVAQRFATRHSILSTDGSLLAGGRYNFRGTYPVLYLACDIHTCVEETTKSFAQSGSAVSQALPRTIVGVEVSLSDVLDLTDPAVRRRLDITRVSLTHTDWVTSQDVYGLEALTQKVGRLARDAGFEAILAPSAALPRTGKNLAILPDQLLSSSRIQVVNRDRLPAV